MTACIRFVLVCGMVLLERSTLRADFLVVNDGATTTNLAKLSNLNGSGGAVTSLTPAADGTLIAAQSALIADLPLRTVWFLSDQFVTNGLYTASADFKPAEAEGRNRGGVMGWLNVSSKKGISFQVSPSSDPTLAFFQVAVVDFTASDESSNEGFADLFNLDGTEATGDSTSAASDVGNYDSTRFAIFQLQFSAPTAADQTSLTNHATAHIRGKVLQVASDGTTNQVGRTIELLTDLAVPAGSDHRFGYFGFWGSLFSEGSIIGQLDSLTINGGLAVA